MKRQICSFITILSAVVGASVEPSITDSIKYSVDLPEIEVASGRFLRTTDGLTILPRREQVTHSFSGYDLLRNMMIPGVTVNAAKGEITALGAQVAVYIDGLPADASAIRQLRPSDVLRVQYIDAPAGRYAGNDVVINFVLRKRDYGGYLSLDALQRLGYQSGDYNLGAKMFHSNTGYILFVGSGSTHLRGAETSRDERIFFPSGPVDRHYSTIDARSRRNSRHIQFRVRDKNDRRTLRATLAFVRVAMPCDLLTSTLVYRGLSPDPLSVATSRSSSSRNFKYSLGLSGTFNLPHDRFLNASASAAYVRNKFSYSNVEPGGTVSSTSRENYCVLSADLSYGMKFSQGKSLTFKATELYNVSSIRYFGDHPSRQHLWSSETIIFGEYVHPLSATTSLKFVPGLSCLAYRLRGSESISRLRPRLQAVFTMQPSPRQYLQMVSLYGNSYPQLSMMSSAVQQVDILQQKRGNPRLRTTRIFRAMAVYGIGLRNIHLQACALYNAAWHLPVVCYSFDGHQLVQSFLPDGVWRQIDAYMSATWTPTGQFNLQATLGYLYNGYFNAARASARGINGSLNLGWYLGTFAINCHLTTPRHIIGYDLVSTHTPWSYGLSASWNRGNMKLEIGACNPFSRRPLYRHILDTPQFRFDNTEYSPADRRSLYVRLNWSLDFGKKTSRENSSVDRTIPTAVLRP